QSTIRTSWYEYMETIKCQIMFFGFLQIYFHKQFHEKHIYMSKKCTTIWTTSDNKIIETIHPPSEKLHINIPNRKIQAAPFKLQLENINTTPTIYETNKIIEQNNYTNKHLQTLGFQLSFATLIYNITKYFIGDPICSKDRTADQLSNLKCGKLDFRWFKETFMTKNLTREDANQPYKAKFIIGLPTLFAEKIKSKYREQYNGIVPYDTLTYSDIFSIITKIGLEICNDIKINKQVKRDAKTYKKEL
ncbi:LOW QUALITY PROTEIN: hypothetical protein CFOL_v3_04168, partial [Cephalotus follicularis]